MKCTVADFIVKYIDNQYIEVDGKVIKYVEGVFTIFGHGNVLGLGQSLEFENHSLNVIQGKNEQGMAHSAIGFSKQRKRQAIYAVTTSIGPGCTNLVTAAATATINRIPLLLFPGDTFETRQPNPVLQQLEQPQSLGMSVTDSLKSVSKYYDRVTNGNQIYSILNNAFSILTCPENTGAVTVALPQDTQVEIIEVDDKLLQPKIWKIKRRLPSDDEVKTLYDEIKNANKVVFVCGGGVKYSEAEEILKKIAEKLCIPIVETQAGKSAVVNCQFQLGGVGVTGTLVANEAVKQADLVIALGSRLNDFTSQSASLFVDKKLININLGIHDRNKQYGIAIDADIKLTLEAVDKLLTTDNKKEIYYNHPLKVWQMEIEKIKNAENEIQKLSQLNCIFKLNEILEDNAIIVGASGSLPADLQRFWECKSTNSYHMEYGYSCMGYEVSSALGVKLACPEYPIYVLVGDGSFNMLHSELITSLQINMPFNIILFDNQGFGCINNLQCEYGSEGYRTEYKLLKNNEEQRESIQIDYSQIVKSYGGKGIKITTQEQLNQVKAEKITTLYDLKVAPKQCLVDILVGGMLDLIR